MTANKTHYEILNVSPSFLDAQRDTSHAIKRAYRRALLRHHPDKNHTLATGSVSIDRISEAYRILSDPASRAVYDRAQRLQREGAHQAGQREDFQTGIETLDLDDFNYDDDSGSGSGSGSEGDSGACWYRSCRCGNDRGFSFTEYDLEATSDTGELVVGCQDCSLWIRVHFSVADQ